MKKVTIYAEQIEETALQQFKSAMEQDFSIQGALMPDAHTGYSLPIGGVIATDGVILPAWVGYDIGCGMCALPTSFEAPRIAKKSKAIFQEIYRVIPVGFQVHKGETATELQPSQLTTVGQEAFKARKGFRALGTLGGGNHFIEIGSDEENRVWIIIHSGSRGIGHEIATRYMRLASGSSKAREGHYGLEVESEKGRAYISDMNWALEFALENRKEMMKKVVRALGLFCDGKGYWGELINRNHNHAEKRDGLWIHRKGATHAEEGMMGVIPGNMRDGSFIVRGKGNPNSLYSSSHGAGRVLGRKQARKKLNTRDFKTAMQGITAKVGASTLDESPMAYKDIFEVMRLQADLVEVIHHVKPIINIKG